MAIQHAELRQQVVQQGNSLAGELVYEIWGDEADNANVWSVIEAYVDNNSLAPDNFFNLTKTVTRYNRRRADDLKWELTVEYGKEKPKTGNQTTTWNLTTTTTTVRDAPGGHVTRGDKQSDPQDPETYPGDAPNNFASLNWDQNRGDYRGQPWFAKAFNFEVTRYMTDAEITQQFLDDVASLQLTTNNDIFTIGFEEDVSTGVNFALGEVLFMGMSGVPRREEFDNAMTFFFKRRPTVQQFFYPIGATGGDIKLTIPGHRGWDYLHYRYKVLDENGQLSANAAYPTTEAEFFYIDAMAPLGDFSKLGIT